MIEDDRLAGISYLQQQIRQEYRTGRQALKHLEGKAKETFMARKTEAICHLVDTIADVVGMQNALWMLNEVLQNEQYSEFSY